MWLMNIFKPHKATPAEISRVEETAQAILDAREPFIAAGWTLSQLYDPEKTPRELRDAHSANDKAVDAAYGFTGDTEADRFEFLIQLRQWWFDNLPATPLPEGDKA